MTSSRIVMAADKIVLQGSKTSIVDDSGNDLAVFTSSGINASTITTGTLDTDTVINISHPISEIYNFYTVTSLTTFTPTSWDTIYPFFSCSITATTNYNFIDIETSIPVLEIDYTNQPYFDIYCKLQQSTDNSTWTDIGVATQIWGLSSEFTYTTSGSGKFFCPVHLNYVDKSSTSGTIYYRLVYYFSQTTSSTFPTITLKVGGSSFLLVKVYKL